MQYVLDADGNEVAQLEESIKSLQNQFCVNTADNALSMHEADVGLASSGAASNEIRRSRILSRLRGTATVTSAMLKNVALSFESGEIDVIENFAASSFAIKFVSVVGRPPNIEDLQAKIEDIKPAHLAVTYLFLYNLCKDVKLLTCGAIKTKTCYEVLNESLEG